MDTITTKIESKNRILWMDMLNIAACICVILLHCNHGAKQWYPYLDSYWLYSLSVYTFAYWPVPIFLMLSFCNNIGYQGTIVDFAKRRATRIGVPYLGWSFFYGMFCIFYLHQSMDIRIFLSKFLTGHFNDNMWFFSPLFTLYVGLPFFRIIINHASKKMLLGFCLLGFLFTSFLPYLSSIINVDFPNLFPIGTNFITVCVIGYMLLHYEIQRRFRLLLYLFAFIVAVTNMFIIYWKTVNGTEFFFEGINYSYPASVIIPMAVFVFFKYTCWEHYLSMLRISPSSVAKISSCSFGIYLLHWGVQVVGCHHCIPCTNPYYGFILTYLICIIIILTLKKIPGLRVFVP